MRATYEQVRLEELWEFDSVLDYIGYAGFIWSWF